MVTVPGAIPVTSPILLTVALVLSELLQLQLLWNGVPVVEPLEFTTIPEPIVTVEPTTTFIGNRTADGSVDVS
jgi:hypothetical protein